MSERSKKILILDIDETVLIALEWLFEKIGFEATTTWEVDEAAYLLGSRHFDLLLIGHHPPEVDVQGFLKRMRDRAISVPCIVLQSGARAPMEWEGVCSTSAISVANEWDRSEIVEKVRRCLVSSNCEVPRSRPIPMAG